MEEGIPYKLKQQRTLRGLTLQQLADRVGCSKSYISQLEKGLTAPSVSMLGKLAEALETPVSEFFQETGRKDIEGWHLAKDQRRTILYPDGKVVSQLLTRGVFQKKMQPLITTIQPGGSLDNGLPTNHPPGCEEFVLLLKGSVEFEINGHPILMEEGDSLYFDGSLPHMWTNTSDDEAEVLFIWTPPVW